MKCDYSSQKFRNLQRNELCGVISIYTMSESPFRLGPLDSPVDCRKTGIWPGGSQPYPKKKQRMMSGNHSSGVMDVVSPDSSPGLTESAVPVDDPADDKLLKRYCAQGDQAAFAELVHRHGPLVWRACRRVLGPTPDAEDAFQATFIVLIRKANAVRWKKSIAGWLYQVAHRVALRSRARIVRHAAVVADSRTAAPVQKRDSADDDRRITIEEEIARLPESLRLPIVMCYMQGLTNSEAASRIGCPEGTVASRLTRARNRLRRRLRARGIAVVGAAALIESLSTGASAALAPALEKATLAVVAQLAAGAAAPALLSSSAVRLGCETAWRMSRQRLLQGGAAVLVGTAVVITFFGFYLRLFSAVAEPNTVVESDNSELSRAIDAQLGRMNVGMIPANGRPDVVAQRPNAAIEALQGIWNLESWEVAGQALLVVPEDQRLEFSGDRCILWNVTGNKPGPVIGQAIFDIEDPAHTIDFVLDPDDQPHRVLCIYELVDDTLHLSIAPIGPRPGKLSSARGDRYFSYVFKRSTVSASPESPTPPD
jgi:RNA polymerase sigma factor (sigma-70 family)